MSEIFKICHKAKTDQRGEPGEPIRWRLTERMVDRDSEVIEPKGIKLKYYKKNPVVLWGHNMGEYRPAIGKILPETFEINDNYLDADIIFDVTNDPFAMMIDGKIRDGFLSTGSVGFRVITISREAVLNGQQGATLRETELFEFSIVNVPANPGATRKDYDEFFDECETYGVKTDRDEFFTKYAEFFKMESDIELKSVIPYKKLPLAPENTAWSFTADDGNAILGDPPNWDRYRSVHCWYDSEKPEIKGSYKLPIAKILGGSLKVVWRGVAAAMAVVLGARGGINVSDTDRKGIYNKLVKYYRDFDKEPPEFKIYTEDEIKLLSDNTEETIIEPPDAAEKVGQVISAANRQVIQSCINDMSKVTKSIKTLTESLKNLLMAANPPQQSSANEFSVKLGDLREKVNRLKKADRTDEIKNIIEKLEKLK